jgi:hypothetical protein|tara:strand:- start:406 stop:699 length:294 start_codon:yes stop_codon:yes gene_type:complete
MFSARLVRHKDSNMLNICDKELLGKTLNRDNFRLKISEKYYAEKIVEKEEARDLLQKSDNINMVGKEIIDLSVNMGIGSQEGVKVIDGVPFLIVFKM